MNARVVSLLPSATELICALGARERLVAVSHECDFPAGVERLPVLTRARFAPVRSSAEIDRAVRSVLRDALAVYDIDVPGLRRADPGLIVTQDLCDVCAVSLDDVRSAVARLASRDVEILSLHPSRVDDLWRDIRRTAEALGTPERAEPLIRSLRARLDLLAAAVQGAARPRVLTIEWIDPPMIGGTWIPELVTLAGGTPAGAEVGAPSAVASPELLRNLDPEVVVVLPCGFDLARTRAELDVLARTVPWGAWTATRTGRIHAVDGNAYFNRPGPRLVDSAELLGGLLHPERVALPAHLRAATIRLAVRDGRLEEAR